MFQCCCFFYVCLICFYLFRPIYLFIYIKFSSSFYCQVLSKKLCKQFKLSFNNQSSLTLILQYVIMLLSVFSLSAAQTSCILSCWTNRNAPTEVCCSALTADITTNNQSLPSGCVWLGLFHSEDIYFFHFWPYTFMIQSLFIFLLYVCQGSTKAAYKATYVSQKGAFTVFRLFNAAQRHRKCIYTDYITACYINDVNIFYYKLTIINIYYKIIQKNIYKYK